MWWRQREAEKAQWMQRENTWDCDYCANRKWKQSSGYCAKKKRYCNRDIQVGNCLDTLQTWKVMCDINADSVFLNSHGRLTCTFCCQFSPPKKNAAEVFSAVPPTAAYMSLHLPVAISTGTLHNNGGSHRCQPGY